MSIGTALSNKTILIVLLAFISTAIFSQEMNTIFSKGNSGSASTGAYGGPLVQATQLANNWGLSIGGKGGVIINQRFAFGGIGIGAGSDYSFVGDNFIDDANASLNVSYGAGGIFAEYISDLTNSIHFSVPINFMAGGVSIKDNDIDIESSGVFIIEPGVNLEFNLTESLIPGITFSYKQFMGSSLDNLNDKDLSGMSIGIVFKFGNF
ncbi:MAG: hypothetical protein ABJG78_12320 [Cyclobacteriaceae bacterium]